MLSNRTRKTLDILQGIVLTAALAAVQTSWAHGDAHKTSMMPVKKEQKPWGIAGDAKTVTRTIQLTMDDAMRFSPNAIRVKQGETIRFVIRNQGKALHEMVIGTRQELDAHAAMMVKFPNMEHDEPYMAHVPSTKTRQMVWTFNQPGDFEFACLITGHYQAGMKGTITVAAR